MSRSSISMILPHWEEFLCSHWNVYCFAATHTSKQHAATPESNEAAEPVCTCMPVQGCHRWLCTLWSHTAFTWDWAAPQRMYGFMISSQCEGLEGILKITWSQPPCHGQLPLDQFAQGIIQPSFEHCQGHSSSRQLIPVPHHPQSKEFPPNV